MVWSMWGRTDPPDFFQYLEYAAWRYSRSPCNNLLYLLASILYFVCYIGHNMKLNKASQWVLGTVGWCAQPKQYGCSRNELPDSFFS